MKWKLLDSSHENIQPVAGFPLVLRTVAALCLLCMHAYLHIWLQEGLLHTPVSWVWLSLDGGPPPRLPKQTTPGWENKPELVPMRPTDMFIRSLWYTDTCVFLCFKMSHFFLSTSALMFYFSTTSATCTAEPTVAHLHWRFSNASDD